MHNLKCKMTTNLYTCYSIICCSRGKCMYKPTWMQCSCHFFFYVHGSMHCESMSIIVQQDATIYSLVYFCKLLYMFRVVTPPVIRSTYNCNYSIWHWSNRLSYLPLSWSSWNCIPTAPWQRKVGETVWPVPDAVITVICAPDDGWSYHPKHV